jgi:hypothetical protein
MKEDQAAAPAGRCICEDPDAPASGFDKRALGCDETGGRFADVSVERCRACGKLWLHYLVEDEAISRSGRWARGLISEGDATRMTPDRALMHLNSLDWRIVGGSYYAGSGGRRTGPFR